MNEFKIEGIDLSKTIIQTDGMQNFGMNFPLNVSDYSVAYNSS
jgi:hypothetical protein